MEVPYGNTTLFSPQFSDQRMGLRRRKNLSEYTRIVRAIQISARTHIGFVRDRNEDCVGVRDEILDGPIGSKDFEFEVDSNPLLAVIADGVGGAVGGDLASRAAVEHLLSAGSESVKKATLDRELLSASDEVARQCVQQLSSHDCATTIAGVAVSTEELLAFNVGDSRVYQFTQGSLQQLSVDHVDTTMNWLLTGYLGGRHAPKWQSCVRSISVLPGTTVLVCSDGLHNLISDTEISEMLHLENSESADSLLRTALDRGGHDNVSLLVCAL